MSEPNRRTHHHRILHNLEQRGRVFAEYIWLDSTGTDVRSKVKTLDAKPESVRDLPVWNYDGSSTGQASTENSEVIIKPQAMFPDPLKGGDNILVLCDAYNWTDNTHTDLTPTNTNFRFYAAQIHEKVKHLGLWYGIEQEYTLFSGNLEKNKWPLGWPAGGYPEAQGKFYCSNGYLRANGRNIVEAHAAACLHAGVIISGTNAEVMPGQWEYQIGPVDLITIGDHMVMS